MLNAHERLHQVRRHRCVPCVVVDLFRTSGTNAIELARLGALAAVLW